MAWMQTTVPTGTDLKPIRGKLFNLAMAGTAGGKLDYELAILTREDGPDTVVMLSPRSQKYVFGLPGDWVEAADPAAHGWTLLYSAGVSLDELGLRDD